MACLAGVFGKIAFSDYLTHHSLSQNSLLAIRLLSFILVFLCNALMMNFFAKSMNLTNSIHAVVVNSSTNFFLTAIIAFALFGEGLSLTWLLGASLILVGLTFMNLGQEKEKEKEKNKKRE
uniref:Uncharacterized protein n=1 Tax=Arcella intermedia TaxID=1963864 RepID=A0A6B2LQP9_9EUKA